MKHHFFMIAGMIALSLSILLGCDKNEDATVSDSGVLICMMSGDKMPVSNLQEDLTLSVWHSDDETVCQITGSEISAFLPGLTKVIALSGNGNKVFFTVRVLPFGSGLVDERDQIDLGLSVNWALCNAGALQPEDLGDVIREAETSIQVMGPHWRGPSRSEWEELLDVQNCQWALSSLRGQKGFVVASLKEGFEDRALFLPVSTSDASRYYCANQENRLSLSDDNPEIVEAIDNSSYLLRGVTEMSNTPVECAD